MPLPRETQEDSFVREFCALASRLRVQTGPLDASNIYYGLPEVYRPGQQDASEVFHYFISVCPLLETFFTAIRTQTQNYSQCRPSNVQTTTFTSCDLHVKETTHAMGPVSLEELILDSTAAEIAIRCQVCLQIHGQQILQTESIASGLVLSLVGNLPRRRVHYPSALDFPIRDGVVELILVGVVRHVGESPREGHYFAVVQDFEDSSCWLCDDSVVSKTTQRVLLGECTGHPVLLFYIRKEVLEASHKRKLETKRTSDRLRQRARRAAKSTEAAEKDRAADAARHQDQRAALPEANREELRAVDAGRHRDHRAALPEANREELRAVDAGRHRDHRATLPAEAAEKDRAANAEAMRSHRAALPEADRQEVCAADAARHRDHRAALSEEALGQSCAEPTVLDFDAQAKQKIRDFISPSNMGRDTCACCNELNPPSKMHAVPPSGAWLACLQRKLKWEHTKYTVNEYTRNFYDVSDKISALSGVPLAKEGIQERDGNYKVRSSLWTLNDFFCLPHFLLRNRLLCAQVLLCKTCYNSLRKKKTSDVPPRLAICNNWATVPLPPSLDALQPTWAEYSVCAKAQVAVLLALNGRSMRQIKSHALVYFNEKPAVKCLPRDLGPEDYFVVFAKLTDNEVVIAKKNRLLVRRVVTDALLKLYRDNIDTYSQVSDNNETIFGDNSEITLEESCSVENDESNIMRETDERFDRPGRDRAEHDAQVFTLSAYTDKRTCRINRSDAFMQHNTREYHLSAFPHLYNNGLGTVYDPLRSVHVPPNEGMRHLLYHPTTAKTTSKQKKSLYFDH